MREGGREGGRGEREGGRERREEGREGRERERRERERETKRERERGGGREAGGGEKGKYINRIIRHAKPNVEKTEKTFKNEQRSKDAAAKKRPNTSGVGKINHYSEDIYIPPYNNTD